MPVPEVEIALSAIPGGFNLEVKSNVLARNVYLQAGDHEGFFSDNYFDVMPGELKNVALETDLTETELKEVLTWRTMADAF